MKHEDADSISIERAHRLPGRRREGGKRDVIVKFSFYKGRESILQMVRKKKPAGIFFMEDSTKAVRKSRFQLKDKLKKARDSGYRASLTHDKRVITNAEGKRNINKYDAVTKNTSCVSSNFVEREWETGHCPINDFSNTNRCTILTWNIEGFSSKLDDTDFKKHLETFCLFMWNFFRTI